MLSDESISNYHLQTDSDCDARSENSDVNEKRELANIGTLSVNVPRIRKISCRNCSTVHEGKCDVSKTENVIKSLF